jgi:hypothetical protein
MEDKILANSQLFVQFARETLGVSASFDEVGVRWLDEYIESKKGLPAETKAKLVNTMGSYFGECVRQTYGGSWFQDQQTGNWAVRINDSLTVYPFAKMHKQFEGGKGESVLGLFTAIPSLLHGAPPEDHVPTAASRDVLSPWWKFWR